MNLAVSLVLALALGAAAPKSGAKAPPAAKSDDSKSGAKAPAGAKSDDPVVQAKELFAWAKRL